ncbi:MAG: hypothetical protein ACJ739_12715 [Acidimicrobiales bacterium]
MSDTTLEADGSRLSRWVAPLVVLLSTFPPLYGLWITQGAPMEEGFMLVFPEMVLDGQVPNRDFLHLYGPGSLWVLAAVFAVAGVSLASERVVGYLQHLGVVFGVYRLLRPWGPWIAAGGGVISALLVMTPSGLAAMAWVGGVALGAWALSFALDASLEGREASWRPVVAGVLAAAALLYRPDLVLALTVAAVVAIPPLSSRNRRRALLGFAAGCVPWLVHVAMAGPGHVIEGLVVQPIVDLRGGRRLPIPPSPHHFDGFLEGAWVFDPPPWPLPAPSGPRQLWLWFFALLATGVLLLVAGWLCRRRTGDHRLLAIAAFSVGLFPQAMQRPDSAHLAWVGCIGFAVLPAAFVELGRAWAARRERGTAPRASTARASAGAGLASVGAVLVILVVVAPHFTYRNYAEVAAKTFGARRLEEVIRHDGREFPYKRDDAVDAVRALLDRVDEVTEPGDRLVVGPGDLSRTTYSEAFLYHLLPDLVPGTKYVEMDPGVADADDSGLADEVADADVVILSTLFDDWTEPNDSRRSGSDAPNEVLRSQLCLDRSFGRNPIDPERGLYELYLPCDRPSPDEAPG